MVRWRQVRVNPFRYLSFEGSADYRQQETEGTKTHTYPVQVSALIYPLGHTRLAPFLLGGEDGTTRPSKDRAISMTRKIDSASMPGRRAPVLPQRPHLDRQHLSLHLARRH